MSRQFTGWHMATILVAFFGVVIAVNFTMARFASSTFGGIVVENSYVASQKFNGWLDAAKSQQALGWDAVTAWRPDGRLAIAVTGAPSGTRLTAVARHPLGRVADIPIAFTDTGDGRFLSHEALPEGRWILRLQLEQGGRQWRREETLR
ncbi:MAG: FixH family protein [Porphyrobacter sp.]|nr:FixH family protein [Porphyrobacter sp.]